MRRLVLVLFALLTGVSCRGPALLRVPTSAMEPTLLIGDEFSIIPRAELPGGHPERGDVVVFLMPTRSDVRLVKRVIGVPGDRVRLDRKQLYLNGQKVVEPYVLHKLGAQEIPHFDTFPAPLEGAGPLILLPVAEMMKNNVVDGQVVVPPGQYFVLGDSRYDSQDSRHWGFVPLGTILGKASRIWLSLDPKTHAARTDRIGKTAGSYPLKVPRAL